MERSPKRRRFLKSTAVIGIAASAGCLSAGQSSSDGPATDDETPASGDRTSPTADPTATAESLTPPDDLDEWLADANGYTGRPARFGAGDRPTIRVGEPVDDALAFAPAVIEVPPMTKVRWDWTGHGGQQNVVALDGTFDSGRTNAQAGTEYHYVFEDTGEYPFVSEPHRDEGMKGAVIVREPPSTGNETVDMWLRDADNFEGEIADRTDAGTVTIETGTELNNGYFGFEPPVLKISSGTRVEWNWSGVAPHNVVFQNADIHSGKVRDDAGVHFQHTFEESGTYRYACQPHRGLGEKGAIIVE
ncbi:halocyanin domain-containing protein [Halorientalis brevis]|uniref:Halocyanin domain-containing protein n=1 Tax=Halorientalis brevis TaxID=1126241 RepID=A0ABD6CHK9_9EURY|nr:halocyanin domain-containing protein [Halorientalis brevis]